MQLSNALPFAPGAILLALLTFQVAQPGGLGGNRKSKPGQKTAGMAKSTFSQHSSRKWGAGAHSHGMEAATSRSMNRNIYHPPSATAIPRSGSHSHLPDMRTKAARGPVKAQHTPSAHHTPAASQHRKGPGAKKRAPKGAQNSVTAQAHEFAMGFLNHDSSSSSTQSRDLRIPAPFF
jgi:hypothetical protein